MSHVRALCTRVKAPSSLSLFLINSIRKETKPFAIAVQWFALIPHSATTIIACRRHFRDKNGGGGVKIIIFNWWRIRKTFSRHCYRISYIYGVKFTWNWNALYIRLTLTGTNSEVADRFFFAARATL